jgi:sugar phosphate permease
MAQIVGGSSVGVARKVFRTRTGVITTEVVIGSLALVGVGLAEMLDVPIGFWVAIGLLTLTALVSAVSGPMQQAYMNGCIPSEQRATVLSFASLMGSAGGVVAQPALGRVADVYSLGTGYIVAGALYAIRLPFVVAVRRMKLDADIVVRQSKTAAG